MFEAHAGLYTDLYELTMAQAYFLDGASEEPAVFDYSFRTLPFGGGFVVFAGLSDFLDYLEGLRFLPGDLEYLGKQGFGPRFLEYLGRFRFQGTVLAPREGEVVFPVEPVVRVEGRLFETQIIETALLNILNFESLIATKAARIRLVAGDKAVSEFGFRRAHGPGGILASRAAVIGGCETTSNVYAAWRYGLETSGTMAHSYVESRAGELEAFRTFAAAHPEGCILLVDTYDTLRSGLPNAIQVAREMEGLGRRLFGVRLDSGDLAFLAKEVRRRLDAAGLHYVRIAASNLLDEHIIKSLLEQGAPIDFFGVGTHLAVGAPDGFLDGVYKLAEVRGKPRLKLSDTLAKTTLPGRKRVLRCLDADGLFRADAVALEDEKDVPLMVHPHEPGQSLALSGFRTEEILVPAMEGGKRRPEGRSISGHAAWARRRLESLPAEHKRFEFPHMYKVGLSRRLAGLRDGMAAELRKEE